MKKTGRKGAKLLKTVHLICVAIWFGGVMSWFPLVYGIDLQEFDSTYTGYLNMRSIAWNVIGWGGIGSFFTGVMNGLFTNLGIFKHKWITFKFCAVIGLILYGMFFLEARLIQNIGMIELYGAEALEKDDFLKNHISIQRGLIFEAAAFISIISISVFKPWSVWKKRTTL